MRRKQYEYEMLEGIPLPIRLLLRFDNTLQVYSYARMLNCFRQLAAVIDHRFLNV